MTKLLKSFTCFLVTLAVAALTHAASPTLSRVRPPGGTRGTELEVTLSGERLKDAEEVMFYTKGITVTDLKAEDKAVKAKFKIENAALGEHQLRIRTKSGISELRTFYVGPYPVAAEKEPNTDFTKPQKVEFNTTITGVVDNEDIDHFLVEAKKGQRITAEVEGIRLGQTLFDPFIAILDPNRFEIASADDTALLAQDSVVSIIAPADGQYIIQLRETSYGGNGNCAYRLHVGNFPRPRAIYPAGGMAGQELQLTYLSDVAGPIKQTIKLPSQGAQHLDLYAEQDGLIAPSPNRIRVSPFPNVLESEPNNDHKTATVYDGELPIAFNGIVTEGNDFDFFKFKAKKGQALDVRVYARQLRSPLDSVLNITDSKGRNQGRSNDDSGGPDSYSRFNAPNDGEYFIQIRDFLKRGGPDFVYRVEITPVVPALVLSIPQVEQYRQDRQAIAVPRGNRFGALVRASRADFGGELVASGADLPTGVTILNDGVPNGLDVFPVIFEAASDAPIGGKLADIVAKPKDDKLKITGGYRQQIELVYGPPNQTSYVETEINKLAVAVTEEAPFKLTVIEPKVPIVQGGSFNLKVKAERKEGFKAPIAIRLLNTPPGINASTTVQIPEGKDEATIPISAANEAQIRTWRIAVIGSANVNGPLWVASQLGNLPVSAPFLTMKLNTTNIEKGKSGKIVAKIEQKTPFDGAAKVHLGGLPANVTAKDAEITSKDDQVEFELTTTDKAPIGQHKGLICQVVVMKDGEQVIHNLGRGGILRIEAPLSERNQKKDDKAKKPEKPPEKKPQKTADARKDGSKKEGK